MDVGVGVFSALAQSGRGAAQLARAAEELGYHSLWTGEHIAMPARFESKHPGGRPVWDPTQVWPHSLVSLGFLAGQTERVRLGTVVIPNLTRDPLSLAKEAATVDVLSGGRLELGLGPGWLKEEAALLGHPSDHPNGRLEETIEILRLAWSEPEFEYHGRFYDFEAVGVHPQPPQGRDLPIWIGGPSPRLLRLTAERAQGNIVSPWRLDLVPAIRGQLPPGTRVGGVLSFAGDRDAYAERVRELEAQGLDLLVVTTRDGVEPTIEHIRWFADEVRPTLR